LFGFSSYDLLAFTKTDYRARQGSLREYNSKNLPYTKKGVGMPKVNLSCFCVPIENEEKKHG
jgi:hypothetical protein